MNMETNVIHLEYKKSHYCECWDRANINGNESQFFVCKTRIFFNLVQLTPLMPATESDRKHCSTIYWLHNVLTHMTLKCSDCCLFVIL